MCGIAYRNGAILSVAIQCGEFLRCSTFFGVANLLKWYRSNILFVIDSNSQPLNDGDDNLVRTLKLESGAFLLGRETALQYGLL